MTGRRDSAIGLAGGLDYGSLARRVGIGARLRTAWRTPIYVYSLTLGVLLLLVPVAVLVLARPSDGGAVVGLLLLAAAGLWVLGAILHQAGKVDVLDRFALDNGLEPVGAGMARDYAAGCFVAGTHRVMGAVRTPGEVFVEVGDRQRVGPGRDDDMTPDRSLYLRVAVPAAIEQGPGSEPLVGPDLRRRLTELTGSHTVEVVGREVTVVGSRPLDPQVEGRLAEAIAIAEQVAARAEELAGSGGGPTTSGITPPAARAPVTGRRRGRHPVVVILVTLALLVVGPFAIAVPISLLEGRPTWVVGLALSLLIGAALAVVGMAVGFIEGPAGRRSHRREDCDAGAG